MKKLITLTFALLFTAGMAFGQNSATTNQNGSGNEAEVTQEANTGVNQATVDQDGDDNSANIEQVYTSSLVGTNPENVARVTQDGDDNSVELLNTVGTSNEYYIEQLGDGNKVQNNAEQGNSNVPSLSGDINVLQDGNDNRVWDMDQYGYENLLKVDQLGNGNVVNVEAQVSTASGFNAGDNEIFITQNGNGNAVGENSTNGAGAYQEGLDNSMDIDQSGGAIAGTTDQPLSAAGPFFQSEGGQGLIQFGDANEMIIDQDGASTVGFVLQDGDMNDATITQTGNGHSATTTQVGNGNGSTITQN